MSELQKSSYNPDFAVDVTDATKEKSQKYNELFRLMGRMVAEVAKHSATDEPPVSLRIGVNSAKADHGALIHLLIQKGVFTYEEYLDAACEFMRMEVQDYNEDLRKALLEAAQAEKTEPTNNN